MTNHIASCLITKGLIQSQPLYKGLICYTYEIIPITGVSKRGGFSNYNTYEPLYNDVEKIGIDNIKAIKVNIDWYKDINRNKEIDVELIEKQIEVELMERFDKKIDIKVEF